MSTFKELSSAAADAARHERKVTHVVWVEHRDGTVTEEDHTTLAGAKARALNAVDLDGALSASFRTVRHRDGAARPKGVFSPRLDWGRE